MLLPHDRAHIVKSKTTAKLIPTAWSLSAYVLKKETADSHTI